MTEDAWESRGNDKKHHPSSAVLLEYEIDQFAMIELLIGITVIIIFAVGIYIHLKKIQICRKEKDATWKLEVTNFRLEYLECEIFGPNLQGRQVACNA